MFYEAKFLCQRVIAVEVRKNVQQHTLTLGVVAAGTFGSSTYSESILRILNQLPLKYTQSDEL